MPAEAPKGDERVCAAEVVAALCLATDLGMGLPFEHGLHSTLVATRLAGRLGVDPETASQTYYACLLAHSGCTTDAHVTAEIFGDSLTTQDECERTGGVAEELHVRGLPEADREAVKAHAQAALERFAGDGGYRIPGVVLCAVAS